MATKALHGNLARKRIGQILGQSSLACQAKDRAVLVGDTDKSRSRITDQFPNSQDRIGFSNAEEVWVNKLAHRAIVQASATGQQIDHGMLGEDSDRFLLMIHNDRASEVFVSHHCNRAAK